MSSNQSIQLCQFLNPQEYPLPKKDGRTLVLLVKASKGILYPTEDKNYFRTTGFNNFENDGENIWYCVGWDWCQDCVRDIKVRESDIVGWMPMPDFPSYLSAIDSR